EIRENLMQIAFDQPHVPAGTAWHVLSKYLRQGLVEPQHLIDVSATDAVDDIAAQVDEMLPCTQYADEVLGDRQSLLWRVCQRAALARDLIDARGQRNQTACRAKHAVAIELGDGLQHAAVGTLAQRLVYVLAHD